MAKVKHEGRCRICGWEGPLSFEHVPPRAAFNDRPVLEVALERALQLGLDEPPRGRTNQKGMGAYTLCPRCNNDTGGWYAEAFSKWCSQGMEVLVRSGGHPRLIYLHHILPLRVIKQIITMAFSANSDRFREVHPELVQFVLDRERRYLHPRYRVFAYYNTEGTFRFLGDGLVAYNLYQQRMYQTTEITFPPFGYVLTVDGSQPDPRLYEISRFARYGYDEFEVAALHLPVLPTHLPIPNDYRTREEIEADAARDAALTAASEKEVAR